mgnify:CR=1 FL=1
MIDQAWEEVYKLIEDTKDEISLNSQEQQEFDDIISDAIELINNEVEPNLDSQSKLLLFKEQAGQEIRHNQTVYQALKYSHEENHRVEAGSEPPSPWWDQKLYSVEMIGSEPPQLDEK